MATDPKQILNQTVPTAQQPTAQEPSLAQASSTLPAGSFPGAAGNVTPGQGFPSQQQQDQPTDTALAVNPVDLPIVQPYSSLLPYLAATEQQPQLVLPKIGDATLQSIQQRLLAQQQQNPLLNGQQPPHPQSQLAKTHSPMTIGDLISTAGQQLWQQEVVKPFQDYISTWEHDPGQALLETAAGAAAIGVIVGAEVLTGGAATPFIFGTLAALQAPNLINAWSQEITHPSDQNLVRAVVSSGSAAIAVGSPVRAFKGVKTIRNLYEAQVAARKDISTADEAADLLIGGREEVRGQLRTGAPLTKQLETLDFNNVDALRAQLDRRGANLEEGPAADLLRHAEALNPMREALQAAREEGDEEGALHALAEMKQYARENLRNPMLSTAYEYMFLPSTPYAHVPITAIDGVDTAIQAALNDRTNAIRGMLRRMHLGFGLQLPSDIASTDIASVAEAQALDRAAGTPFDTANRIVTRLDEMAKRAGLESLSDNRIEDLYQALEEPEKWKKLVESSPDLAAFAQKIRDISDMMSVGELKFGTISHALQGRVAHYFIAPAAEAGKAQEEIEKAAKAIYTTSWLTRPIGSRSSWWKAAVDDETGRVEFQGKTRSQIIDEAKEQRSRAEEGHGYRQLYGPNEQQFISWRRSYAQLTKRHKNEARAAAVLDQVRQQFGDVGVEIVKKKRGDLDKLLRARYPSRELVTGGEVLKRMLTNHVFRMQRAMYGEAYQSHANLGAQRLKEIFGSMPMENWGGEMRQPEFKERHALPDVIPETIFGNAGDKEEAAKKLGYFLIHSATGNSKDLHYRPALYGRGELANQIAAAGEKATTGAEHQSSVINALYKTSALSKRFIMYNPMYHFLNVAGRAIAWMASDPRLAGGAIQALRSLHEDQAAYHDLIEESAMAGMVHANQWNVAEHLRMLQREEDGQPSFFGAIRNIWGAANNIHRETAERGLWATVDQLQLAGYLYSKQRFLDRGIREMEARKLAAQYANNLGGMVNPLYMSRLWRQMKGMIFFAPSYWSTFLHSLQSVMPGAARLSEVTARIHGGRMAGLGAVPLRAIDRRSRIELVRAQRDWMITYLASTAVAMDMMNVMFSGHHLWENEQGHQWNIDVTNMPYFGGTTTSPSGEVKRAYISTMPFFRQGVDIGNAIGLGHDWGFGHVFGDTSWNHQDAYHKAIMAIGALKDGIRRAGSTKLGNVPVALGDLATGQDVTSFLGSGTQVKVDGPAALMSLLPQGYQLQRIYKTYADEAQAYPKGSPQQQQAQQRFQQQTRSAASFPNALWIAAGLPSVYHMGVERPLINDSAFENWTTQRDASHTRMTQYSNEVFAGIMSPTEYARHKHEEMVRMNQLNADTWGKEGGNTSAESLNAAYTQLSNQFGLNETALSDQQWFERYDAFLPAWEQMLQSASPSTRATWWDHHTQQWTDADYLEWEARQLKDALAASIDGQGGKHIRAYQNQIFRLRPTMTLKEYQQLEDADPYYSTYKTLLAEMGRTSPLGAFVSAFSSPFSRTYIPPIGTTAAEAQTLAQHTGQTVVRAEQAQRLAQQAKRVAQEQGVAEAGGTPEGSPEFQQQEQAAFAAARSGIPEAPGS